MRKIFLFTLIASLSFPVFAKVKSGFQVGETDYLFTDSIRYRKLNTYVWYPTRSGAKMRSLDEPTKPFLPVVSAKNAPLALSPKGGFPVVLLSHGSMGEAKRLFWLADALVREGFVVVAVDHPGNRTGDSTADGLMRVW